jgi:hypothetical protein
MCAHESCPEPYNRFAEMAMVNICFLVAIPYFFLWLALADSNSSLSNIINLRARLFSFGSNVMLLWEGVSHVTSKSDLS